MWVRLTTIKQISVNGKPTTCHPGEWVEVGGQLARSWLVSGDADRPDQPDLEILPGCGIVVAGAFEKVSALLPGLDVVSGEPALAFSKTLYWNTRANFRPEFVGAGFKLLDRWEIAVPLAGYEHLAGDIGSEEERSRTVDVIRDLRVPYYDIRLMFLRRCQRVEKLLALWRDEAGDRRLAFLRALYRVKPMMQALPVMWIG
jgi:hypothetical protein